MRGKREMAHAAPKQLALRFCASCTHLEFAEDVCRLDQVKPQRCNECNSEATAVHLYALQVTP